ncbi:hypothetical protein ACQP25_44555 (plasmid) [Microtetraspora malaysiensis]|uniref:hypothetical protein n=1 Tax=Microtetraspora malaysiensis TaxID=161358 RepID=UPI003D8A0A7D
MDIDTPVYDALLVEWAAAGRAIPRPLGPLPPLLPVEVTRCACERAATFAELADERARFNPISPRQVARERFAAGGVVQFPPPRRSAGGGLGAAARAAWDDSTPPRPDSETATFPFRVVETTAVPPDPAYLVSATENGTAVFDAVQLALHGAPPVAPEGCGAYVDLSSYRQGARVVPPWASCRPGIRIGTPVVVGDAEARRAVAHVAGWQMPDGTWSYTTAPPDDSTGPVLMLMRPYPAAAESAAARS